MKYNVLVTDNFRKEFKKLHKKYPSLKNDILQIVNQLELSPKQGISLGRNCYKIRVSITSKGKGKSGGGRLITYLTIQKQIVYLLSIYDKSNKESIEDHELDFLLKISGIVK
ncbi:MAG: type II toxin-antitoxin system RelE/ParE family toxin [Bacteroidales bacterium]|nr:type II toxin-antitoxin system RelE/ParE family toxin [Bacteroidales bacterium]MCF8387584.1 type II toxin-antitoxin system RelE/ParE family toxin [Bacteroidales bacterium]MCF8397026.1 type II toxin-antitoxin system RelE/ParE family toxin [Bacteroidales bacterium]